MPTMSYHIHKSIQTVKVTGLQFSVFRLFTVICSSEDVMSTRGPKTWTNAYHLSWRLQSQR